MHTSMFIHINLYIYMYMYIYVYIYICVYICMMKKNPLHLHHIAKNNMCTHVCLYLCACMYTC